MKSLACLFAVVLVLGLSASCRPEYPPRSTAQLTLRLVDDNGQPVPQAKVAIVGFHVAAEGKTDDSGCFLATLRTVSGEVDLEASKEGYYSINRHTYLFIGETNGQFYPWNPLIELQFHKIEKPVPMVVKRMEEYLPALSEPVGYDLLIGDWVHPYGKGLTNDFIFRAERQLVDDMNYSGNLILSFSDPADGLVLHRLFYRDDYELRLAPMAPVTGYINNWVFIKQSSKNPADGLRKDYTSFSEDDNYYFRVRSRTNDIGEVTSAMYGKIYWGIQYAVGNTNINRVKGRTNSMPWIRFQYFLNPDGTRNTEFDTGRNLCPHPGTYGKGH